MRRRLLFVIKKHPFSICDFPIVIYYLVLPVGSSWVNQAVDGKELWKTPALLGGPLSRELTN